MITLTAKIHLIDSNSDSLDSAVLTPNRGKSNISSDTIPIGNRPTARRPFIFGASKFGEGYTFEDKVDYYIGGTPSNKDGVFVGDMNGNEVTLSYGLQIYGTNLSSVTIDFDTADNQFPTRIVANGKSYNNDDASFTLTDLKNASSVLISFSNWNKPFFPAKIEAIYVRKTIEINRRNLLSMKTSVFDRGNISSPSFGVRSNSSSIDFRDTDGEIEDYANMGSLKQGLKVEMFVTDTLAKKSQRVATSFAEDWSYDFNNKTASVAVTDGLEEWQSIIVPSISIDVRKDNQTDMTWLYEHLKEFANKNSRTKVAELHELDSATLDALRKVKIVYPILNECSLWSAFSKLCVACLCHLYVGADGLAKPHYTGGD